MAPSQQHKGSTGSGQTSQIESESRQASDQKTRQLLFAGRVRAPTSGQSATAGQLTTASGENLQASSQLLFEKLEELGFAGVTAIPSSVLELLFQKAEAGQLTDTQVLEGTIFALPTPSTRIANLAQLQSFIGTIGSGTEFAPEVFRICDRDQTYGQNPELFHFAIGVSPGESGTKTSVQRQITSLEEDGKYVLTAHETTMLILAMISAGFGPRAGETATYIAAGSMLEGSPESVPIISVTTTESGETQIWTDFISTVGSVDTSFRTPWCTSRTFGHGSSY